MCKPCYVCVYLTHFQGLMNILYSSHVLLTSVFVSFDADLRVNLRQFDLSI